MDSDDLDIQYISMFLEGLTDMFLLFIHIFRGLC